mmetsp:Transcript_59051/g.136192  ORF Transcript_59051/g.136192 Transcript_59051/m.136192 type:complete len:177 (+) Transcript_59051:353-883(+)
MPEELLEVVGPGEWRVRGLGWALAPPHSDPQVLHADLWGGPRHPRRTIRFPHLLWKPGYRNSCTTEVVPGAFTQGGVAAWQYRHLRQASSPSILCDGEVLHRGGRTGGRWGSSLSIELCSAGGWEAWNHQGTGGSAPSSDEDWRMLRVAPGSARHTKPDASQELQREQRRWEALAG